VYHLTNYIWSDTRWGVGPLHKGGIGLSRRLFLVLSTGAFAAAGLFGSNAAQAAPSTPSGGACQLAGTANFAAPGLTSSSTNFTYGFQGNLSGCQSNTTPPSPASGKESAGQTIAYNGGTYQEPQAKGTGGCSNSTTSGVSITQWADGDYTVAQYSTTGAGAAVSLQGTVIKGIAVTGTDSTGAPSTVTIATNEPSTPVGASVIGELTFSTANPTDVANCAGSGLTSAAINGLIETGQS
jgi:hypothetical protein